jgi:hypothetical protein
MPHAARLVITAFTLLLAACAGEAPLETSARAKPSSASAAGPAAPPADAQLAAAIRKALGGDWEARYFDAAVDLQGDGRQEAVVMVAGPMVCGTGGCPVMVFAPAPGGYRLVTQISVAHPPVQVAPRRAHGWRNLIVRVYGGGVMKAYDAELAFDGSSYPTNPTVPPALPATSLTGVELLIPEFETYRDGKPLPAEPAR